MSSGCAVADQPEGGRDVVARLARIAELQEEPDADARGVQPPRGLDRLLDLRSLVHRVEHALRAGLRADPHDLRAGAPKRVDRVAAQQQVDPAEALERRPHVALLDEVARSAGSSPGLRPRTSSTNEMWSGAYVSRSQASSSATLSALRTLYR